MDVPSDTDYVAVNRANWNERADRHRADATGFHRVSELLSGANLLTPIERAELGDLTGFKVAHLQCHIGLDTISLARMGADEVVGLDFSPSAIRHARELAQMSGAPARFVEGTVYDAPSLVDDDFDLAVTSWGTIVWMDDLDRWAQSVARCLRPGGALYYCDCHPFAWMLAGGANGIFVKFDYANSYGRPLPVDVTVNYDLSPEPLVNCRTYEWSHSLSRILNSLIGAGLQLEWIHEHEALQWKMLDHMIEGPDHLWRLPADAKRIPLALSLRAVKR